MKDRNKKATNFQCEYLVTRDGSSVEHISLETKTYPVHDSCFRRTVRPGNEWFGEKNSPC